MGARQTAHETGYFLTPFLLAPHVLWVRETVDVQGLRCLTHGDNEAMYDDAVVIWASSSGSRNVTSGEQDNSILSQMLQGKK